MKWILLCGAILSEVAASLSLKGSATVPALYAVVVAGYVVAFVLLTLVLRRGVALGVAYGIWGAGGVALTAGASAMLFDEAFTGLMIVGLGLVIVGVVVLELGSEADGSQRAPATDDAESA